MSFADPAVCPACRGRLDGSSTCRSCGMDLGSEPMRRLWQTLLEADRLLAESVADRDQAVAPPPPRAPAPSVAPPMASPTSVPAAPRPDRSWSVGTVLLALGAFGLVVAALIFVSRSWDSIGVAGKAAVMLTGTAAVGAAAVWVTRRPLRASAEALWTVFAVLVVVDVLAARAEGLGPLDDVPYGWVWAVGGVLLSAVAAAILMWARPHLDRELWVGSIGSTVGLAMTAGGTVAVVDARAFWRVFVSLVVVGLLGLALRVTASRRVAWGARGVLAVLFAVAAVLAFVELVDNPALEDLAGDFHGLPMLLISAAAVVIGGAVASARTPMTALGLVGLGLLVVVPSTEAWQPEGGLLAAAVVTTGYAAVGVRAASSPSQSGWIDGVRWAAAIGIAWLGLMAAAIVGVLFATWERALDVPWDLMATDRLPLLERDELSVWPVAVFCVGLIVSAVSATRWPTVARFSAGPMAVVLTVVTSALVLTTAIRPPWWVAVTACLVLAVALAAWHASAPTSWAPLFGSLVSVVAAAIFGCATQPLFVVAWIGAGLLAAFLMTRASGDVSYAPAALVVPAIVPGVAAGVDLAGADDFWVAVTTVLASLGLLVGSIVWRTGPGSRRLVEAVAALGVVVGLVACGDGADAAAVWTVVGVVACALAASGLQRTWYVVPGIACLLVAYVLFVVGTGSSVVEAYTLPLGLAALAAGVWWMRRRPDVASWPAIGGGLALSLLPSLPQALAEPTGVRALVLGVGAIAVIAAGVALNWQSPFVLGTGVATAVLLFNIGPYANAAPRAVLIAVVSVVLVAVGVTWEDRVRDGRRIIAFVRGMR